MNIFESILAFNEFAALKKLDAKPKFIDESLYTLNFDLLLEELKEYLHACKNNDLKGIADAVGDMFVVIWGIICKHGMHSIFLEKIVTPICISNETKYCNTREEALESIKKYAKKNINTKYFEFNGKYVIMHASSMKLLKGINYQEPKIEL